MAWPRMRPSARSTLGSKPLTRGDARHAAEKIMFQRSGYSRAISAHVSDIEQRLRTLERHLEAAGNRSAATAAQAANHVGESVASALSSIAENLRGRANSMRDDVAKIGGDAAKLGDQALRRLADEVEHRPLVTLAVALAVGILVGLASHPRESRPPRAPARRRQDRKRVV